MVTRGRDDVRSVVPVVLFSSRRPKPDRMRRLFRLAILTGTAVCAAAALVPSMAGADTARLEPTTKTKPGELPRNDDHRIVITDGQGTQRTLGPVPSGRLFADPGGRHLLVLPDGLDDPAAAMPRLVPLDGSEIRPLRVPAGVTVELGLSQLSWTPDGSELLVSHAIGWDPEAFAKASQVPDISRYHWVALRCPLSTGICSELPAPGGFAVGVPDGVLTTSSVLSAFPISWLFEGLRERDLPEWERPSSRRGRMWAAIANDRRVVGTQLVGPPATPLSGARRTGPAGVPVALAAAGGPAGAAISRATFVTRLERRRGRVRLNLRTRSPRLLLARPGTPLRMVVSRPIALSQRDRRRIHASTADHDEPVHFHPQLATADGWIGGGSVESLVPIFAVLATLDGEGRVRPVEVQGRPATAWNLLRTALNRSPGRVAGAIELVGYEAAGNAIVTVEHGFGMEGIPERSSTLRVPLHGSALPTVIRSRVDAAW